jgi:hypothetical protein
VQEGSPPTEEAPSAAGEATPPEPTEESAEDVAPEERTADEVEAIWKNRVAGKDRAHAESERVLRQQIDDLNRQMQGRQATDTANMSEVEREKARADAAEARAEQAERQRVQDLRTLKYAAAAEVLDASELAVIDEARLAALNARLTGDETPAPPVIDPNAARRPPSTTPAAPRERSVEELEADLKRHEPAFKESLGT